MIYGLSSAVLALLGTVLGNYFFYCGFIAKEEGIPFLEVFLYFLTSPADLVGLFAAAFDFMDILFYGLAAYVGFSTAIDARKKSQPATVPQ
jgi:hypothetical protein